jgi:C4-dicarboxylate transporter DctQ subunit
MPSRRGGIAIGEGSVGVRKPQTAPAGRFMSLIDAIVKICRVLAAVMLLCSVALNFANIVGRYFLSEPIAWAEEIMLFLMVGAVFFGNCAVGWEGRQIRMDVIVSMLPPRVRRMFEYFAEIAFIVTAVALVYFAWPVVVDLYEFDQRSQAANIPMVIPQAIIPLGLAITAVLVVVRFVRQVGGAADGRDGQGRHGAAHH